jgi:hypothetical protein
VCAYNRQKPSVQVSTACAVCVRAQTASSVSVLDVELGVKSAVWLCARHLPNAAQLAYVYDIASLRRLLQHRASA